MRKLRAVVIQGVEYQDITHAAAALDVGPEVLLKELYRKGGDRWVLNDSDHFISESPEGKPENQQGTWYKRPKGKPKGDPEAEQEEKPKRSKYQLVRGPKNR